MTSKADFTTQEWNKLVGGVMLVATAITAADPSGVWGMLKEGMANAGALRDVWANPTGNQLIKSIAEEFKSSDGRGVAQEELRRGIQGAERDQVLDRAMASIREAVNVVDSKATVEDAKAYKSFLMTIAQRVANAANEGGFLGFGGERISSAEQLALDDLERVLSA